MRQSPGDTVRHLGERIGALETRPRGRVANTSMGQQQEAPSRRGLDLGVDRVVMVEVAALHDPGARILHVLESDCVKLSAFSPSTRLELGAEHGRVLRTGF